MLKDFIGKIKKGMDTTINIVVIALSASLVCVVFLQVFSRYALNYPITWSEELARYLFVWIVFTSSVVVFREDRHMGVDFLVKAFPDKVRHNVQIIAKLLIFVFIVSMLAVSPRIITIAFKQRSPTLNLPIGVVYLAFPVSLFLMFLETIFRILLREKKI